MNIGNIPKSNYRIPRVWSFLSDQLRTACYIPGTISNIDEAITIFPVCYLNLVSYSNPQTQHFFYFFFTQKKNMNDWLEPTDQLEINHKSSCVCVCVCFHPELYFQFRFDASVQFCSANNGHDIVEGYLIFQLGSSSEDSNSDPTVQSSAWAIVLPTFVMSTR